MKKKKQILGINGSASLNSTNILILKTIADLGRSEFELELVDNLSDFPHFQTELTDKNVPDIIEEFRSKILSVDGIIFSTPEYVFSIPSRLKNAIEWCVSTTVFTNKPVGIITASASGEKGHEELKLLMGTVQSKFTEETTLLISGAKGKFDKNGKVLDNDLENRLKEFTISYIKLLQMKETGGAYK